MRRIRRRVWFVAACRLASWRSVALTGRSGAISLRFLMSKRYPDGSEWRVTPETMIGRCRLTSYASVWIWAGSMIVTEPFPRTSRMPFGLTSAAVSSSMPRPSRAGDWATRARRRPNRLRCSKCWSMSTPGSRPSPALIWVILCFGVAPLVPKATM
jgi:hypothetical protein